jgi:hypothetical protein
MQEIARNRPEPRQLDHLRVALPRSGIVPQAQEAGLTLLQGEKTDYGGPRGKMGFLLLRNTAFQAVPPNVGAQQNAFHKRSPRIEALAVRKKLGRSQKPSALQHNSR